MSIVNFSDVLVPKSHGYHGNTSGKSHGQVTVPHGRRILSLWKFYPLLVKTPWEVLFFEGNVKPHDRISQGKCGSQSGKIHYPWEMSFLGKNSMWSAFFGTLNPMVIFPGEVLVLMGREYVSLGKFFPCQPYTHRQRRNIVVPSFDRDRFFFRNKSSTTPYFSNTITLIMLARGRTRSRNRSKGRTSRAEGRAAEGPWAVTRTFLKGKRRKGNGRG